MKIEVHIATYGSRIKGLEHRLIKDANVIYRVVHQNYKDFPNSILSNRSDVFYYTSDSKGVAHSRNMALMAAEKRAVILFSDDDVIYNPEIFSTLRKQFTELRCDFITFKVGLIENREVDMLTYRTKSYDLKWYNVGKYGAINLAVRAKHIEGYNITFDLRFGPGAKFCIGEDYIFIQDLIKNSLKGYFLPTRLIYHPKDSTGTRLSDELILHRGPMFLRAHGFIKGLVVSCLFGASRYGILKALRMFSAQIKYINE